MNDSSTGGVLLPTSTPPANDLDLDKVIQPLVAALTGLPAILVKPAWQETLKGDPDPSTNWCLIGVTEINPTGYTPAIITNPDGSTTMRRHEHIEVTATFYGPQGQQYATQLRDGLWLAQNLEGFPLSLLHVGQLRALPEMVNKQWRRRYDLPITFARQVVRDYAIRTLLSAEIDLHVDQPKIDRVITATDPR